jgi:hypothetical protein
MSHGTDHSERMRAVRGTGFQPVICGRRHGLKPRATTLAILLLLIAPMARAEALNLTPLTDFKADQAYKGMDGGLYGGDKNEPPAAHAKAAQEQTRQIVPLDADGKPSPDGKIALLSIGMSNTTQEFSRFKEIADRDPDKSPKLMIVDGAQGGRDAADWATRVGSVWDQADHRLSAAHVSANQVEVVWLKQALKQPASLGEFPTHAEKLESDLISIIQLSKSRYPNLRIAYLSSRTYGGYAVTRLNPEPYAYESAFAVRGVIQKQVDGDPALNFDPARGKVNSPLVLWGPYLWADGAKGRGIDKLVWLREDFGPDGTHPSPQSGRQKVADLLLKFFKSDPNSRTWFVNEAKEKR